MRPVREPEAGGIAGNLIQPKPIGALRRSTAGSTARRETSMRKTPLIAAALICAMPAIASAQDMDLARRGEALARSTCVACHGVGAGQAASPITDAPSFQTLAATPGITSMAITVALSTAHKTMPNIQLSPDEMREIAAYIVSLRAAP